MSSDHSRLPAPSARQAGNPAIAKSRTLLIWRVGGIGDMLWCTAALPALRRLGLTIDFCTDGNGREVLANNPHIRRLIPFEDQRAPDGGALLDTKNHQRLNAANVTAWFREIATGYDCAVPLTWSAEGVALWRKSDCSAEYGLPQADRQTDMHYTDEIVRRLAMPWLGGLLPQLWTSKAERKWLDTLRARHVAKHQQFLLWHIGGSSYNKILPQAPQYIGGLLEQLPNLVIYLLGDDRLRAFELSLSALPPAARERCISTRPALELPIDDRVYPIPRQPWTLRQQLIATSIADCVVGPESSVVNAAACWDTPKVIFYSHSRHENLSLYWWNAYPFYPTSQCDCAPCYRIIEGEPEECRVYEADLGWGGRLAIPEVADLEAKLASVAGAVNDSSVANRDSLTTVLGLCERAKALPGDAAEAGVYRGATAKLICQSLPEKPVWLFDTFSGMPAVSAQDQLQPGVMGDTSIEAVEALLADCPNARLMPGLFPDTARGFSAEHRFAFVHLDMDIYQSTLDGLEWFVPRLVPGGLVVLDDYNTIDTPGVPAALSEWIARPDNRDLVDLHMVQNPSGCAQAVLIRRAPGSDQSDTSDTSDPSDARNRGNPVGAKCCVYLDHGRVFQTIGSILQGMPDRTCPACGKKRNRILEEGVYICACGARFGLPLPPQRPPVPLIAMTCPICGTATVDRVGMGWAKCPCGIVFQDPQHLDQSTYEANYTAKYDNDECRAKIRAVGERWLPTIEATLRECAIAECANDKPRLLEIGYCLPENLELARSRGWDVAGCEINPTAARDFPVIGTDFEKIDLEGIRGTFDAVMSNHVFEHFTDPVKALQTMAELVRPGGLILVATPDASNEHITAHLHRKDHYIMWTPATLTAQALRLGLEVVEVETHDGPECGFISWYDFHLLLRKPLCSSEALASVALPTGSDQ